MELHVFNCSCLCLQSTEVAVSHECDVENWCELNKGILEHGMVKAALFRDHAMAFDAPQKLSANEKPEKKKKSPAWRSNMHLKDLCNYSHLHGLASA